MISKRIDRIKKSSNFERLGHYVLEAQNEDSLILWTRTAEYVVDMKGEGEKVLWFRMTHCEAEIPAMAIAEIMATQGENSRSNIDKTYHMVLSFPEGEAPTQEQMEDIEDRMCEELGYREHQRISAVHKNTDNVHLHVAINKVHPKNFNVHTPHRDFYIMDRICEEMELKHGLTIDNRIGQGQGIWRTFDAEAHHGKPSFLGWIDKNVKEQLLHAQQHGQSWQDLHAILGEYGLVIKPKGAGLVIAVEGNKRTVKASSVDRKLSFQSLMAKFGEFEPSKLQIEPKQRYTEAKNHDFETETLFKEFQANKNEALQKRQHFKAQRTEVYKDFRENLKTWATQEREKIRASSLSAKGKQEAYRLISKEREKAINNYKQAEAENKQAFYMENPILTWNQYLLKVAEQGNTVALARLRNRNFRKEEFSSLFLTADNLETARNIVFQDQKPYANKYGELVYQLKDGGKVIDQKHRVSVNEHTAASAFLALSLATERFQGQPLDVQGTESFKNQIVEFSVKYDLDVVFKDPTLERERHRLNQAPKGQRIGKVCSPALMAYLDERNKLRERVQSIPKHRVWIESDAGEVTFQGLRNLTDGSQVTLWKKQEDMLVKPVWVRDESKGIKIGQAVRLDKDGKIVKPRGRGH